MIRSAIQVFLPTLLALLAPAAALLAQAQDAALPHRLGLLYRVATADSIAERLSSLIEDKKNRITDEGTELRMDVPAENAIYTFTKPGHGAHPSVVRRGAGQRDGKVYIDTTGVTAADRSAFEKWFAVFLRQDDEIRARLRIK
jgi:hypothetical protein